MTVAPASIAWWTSLTQVGWANSSLRAPKNLPEVSNIKGKGIVLETPLEDALHPSDRHPANSEGAAGLRETSSTANDGTASMATSSSRGIEHSREN